MTVDEGKQRLREIVNSSEKELEQVIRGLDADQRTTLLSALLDRYGEERVKEAVASLDAGDGTKVVRAVVEGLATHDDADKRFAAATRALDAGHQHRLLVALSRNDPARLLEAAAKALAGSGSSRTKKDLALETEDVLRRVRADVQIVD